MIITFLYLHHIVSHSGVGVTTGSEIGTGVGGVVGVVLVWLFTFEIGSTVGNGGFGGTILSDMSGLKITA